MNHQLFADCVNPKAKGALNIHTELQSLNVHLDFFLLTSDISGLLGNTGQTNYSAANSALDALARQRHAVGLPATVLVLPTVLDVGVVAENNAIESFLRRKGLYGIDEEEMLQGFEAAMVASRQDTSFNSSVGVGAGLRIEDTTEVDDESQFVMGMEARELARSMMLASEGKQSVDALWYDDVRFCHVRSALDEIVASKNGYGGSDKDNIATSIKEAMSEGVEAAVKVIAKHIAKRLSSILMKPVDGFELDGPSLGSYGLDSMIGTEMRTWLFKEFALDYPFQKLLAPTLTFKGLAKIIAENMGLEHKKV